VPQALECARRQAERIGQERVQQVLGVNCAFCASAVALPSASRAASSNGRSGGRGGGTLGPRRNSTRNLRIRIVHPCPERSRASAGT
jgi:hypothetical protein